MHVTIKTMSIVLSYIKRNGGMIEEYNLKDMLEETYWDTMEALKDKICYRTYNGIVYVCLLK